MGTYKAPVSLGWSRLFLTVGLLSLLVAVLAVTVGIAIWYRLSGYWPKARLFYVRKARPSENVALLGIAEQAGCLVEASDDERDRRHVASRMIKVVAKSLNNLAPIWEVNLAGEYLVGWPSSVSLDGTYLAAMLTTHIKPLPKLIECRHLVFFDLKHGKIAWVWPETPVPLDNDDPRYRHSGVYFTTDHEAYWSRLEDNKAVIYKLNIPGRRAEPFLTEGSEACKVLEGGFDLEGYSRATQELLVSSGKFLYAITLEPQPRWRVLLDDLPAGERRVHVSANGATIAVLAGPTMTLLHGPPDFKTRCRITRDKIPYLGGSLNELACSPNGQYLAYCYFRRDGLPATFLIFNLSGRVLLQFNTGYLGESCYPVLWFEKGTKIAAAVRTSAWCIWELEGLK